MGTISLAPAANRASSGVCPNRSVSTARTASQFAPGGKDSYSAVRKNWEGLNATTGSRVRFSLTTVRTRMSVVFPWTTPSSVTTSPSGRDARSPERRRAAGGGDAGAVERGAVERDAASRESSASSTILTTFPLRLLRPNAALKDLRELSRRTNVASAATELKSDEGEPASVPSRAATAETARCHCERARGDASASGEAMTRGGPGGGRWSARASLLFRALAA